MYEMEKPLVSVNGYAFSKVNAVAGSLSFPRSSTALPSALKPAI